MIEIKPHVVVHDPSATGHDRYTCECGRTIVRQPHMNDQLWNDLVAEIQAHALDPTDSFS